MKLYAVHPDQNRDGGDPEKVALLARARSTLTGPERDAYLGLRRFNQVQRELHARHAQQAATRHHRSRWDELGIDRIVAEARAELEVDEARQASLARQRASLDEEAVEAEIQAILEEAEADYLRVTRAHERDVLRALYGSDPVESPEAADRRASAAMRAVDRWIDLAMQDLRQRAGRGRSPNG